MGHLYEFCIHGKTFGCNAEDPRSVCLGDFQLRPAERFRYRYKFLAFWESDLRLEATVPLHEGYYCNGDEIERGDKVVSLSF